MGPLYNAHDDEVVVSDIDRANLLNTYFSNIRTADNGRLPVMVTIKPSAYKLEQILFTTANVTAAIRKWKVIFLVDYFLISKASF